MQIDTKEVREGKHDGDVVWVCHYNRPDMNKKALRNIPPTKVLIRPESELPKNKVVYYSESFFSPLNRQGNPLAKVISPVDNTGYRSNVGNELFVFDNEKDCDFEWARQVQSHVVVLDGLIRGAAKHWQTEKNILLNSLGDTV